MSLDVLITDVEYWVKYVTSPSYFRNHKQFSPFKKPFVMAKSVRIKERYFFWLVFDFRHYKCLVYLTNKIPGMKMQSTPREGFDVLITDIEYWVKYVTSPSYFRNHKQFSPFKKPFVKKNC